MNIEVLKSEINEYFEYIKTIYLNEFSRYMTEDTKSYIKSLTDIFELNEDLTFKISREEKIIFHLDLKNFIEENHLKDENNLLDISEEGRNYIAYLVQNENNVYQVIKNKILKEIISYFCKCSRDVVALGTVDMMTEYLSDKYKLPSEHFISSKEKEVAFYLKEIVGEKILLTAIINHQEEFIKEAYNLYVENNSLEDYDRLKVYLNKIYNSFFQKIGKVYFVDSLYDYENLDYGILGRSKQVREEKKNLSMMQLKRLSSLKLSLLNINNHPFLFSASEKMLIQNAIIETDKILKAIMIDGREHVIDHIGSEYSKLLKIEEKSLPFVQKIWASTLTNVENYQPGKDFNFLVTNSISEDIVEATYVTSDHLRDIKTSRNDYGFIIEPVDSGLIYASSKDFLYRDCSKDKNYKPTCNTIYVNNVPLEIDNQEISKLITPSMIEEDNKKEKMIQNKIILDNRHLRKSGIYVFTDDVEDNPSYNKALLLAEEYDLPLIKISPRSYFEGVEEKRVKMDVRIKLTEVPKQNESLFDKVKKAKDRLLYETGNEIEKTL